MQPTCTHKIGFHSSKPSHTYPIVRLPREFRELAGSRAEIYQTTHEGSLAFLVKVVSRASGELRTGSESKAEPLHGGDREFKSLRAHLFSRLSAEKNAEQAFFDAGCCEWSEPISGGDHSPIVAT
ncbi:MAG: hypothetical protein ACXV3U_05525 [Halobacteriota archaeon]